MSIETIIDNSIISQFISAVKNVLDITAGETIEDHIMYLDKSTNLPGEVSASIELAGDLNGNVAVSFTKEYARIITSKIMCCDVSDVSDEDAQEGLGEIVNQVCGKVRTDMWNFGCQFEISIPSIVNSSIHQIETNEIVPVHIIVFKSGESMFSLQVNVQEKNIL